MISLNQRGNTAVELSLLLPVWLVVLTGIIDIGGALFVSHRLNDIARDTARRAATLPNFTPTDISVNTFVANELAKINSLAADSYVLEGPLDVAGDGSVDLMVRVTVNGTYGFSFIRVIGVNQVNLSETVTMRFEWQEDQVAAP